VRFDNFSVTTNNSPFIPVTGITLDESEIALNIGQRDTLEAIIIPNDAVYKDVTWKSDNVPVAAVSTTGIVLGRAVGTAIITATTNEGGFAANCTVKVAMPSSLETAQNNSQQAYPNPTDGILTLNFETAGKRHVSICNMSGTLLLSKQVDTQNAQIDISNFPADIYLLVIDDGKQKNTTKIIKN